MVHLLAQESESSIASVFVTSLMLIVLVVLLCVGVMWIRRQIKTDDTGGADGFTLSDLRKLHKSGQMTDDEYEKAKTLIIGTVKPTQNNAASHEKSDKPPSRNV